MDNQIGHQKVSQLDTQMAHRMETQKGVQMGFRMNIWTDGVSDDIWMETQQ